MTPEQITAIVTAAKADDSATVQRTIEAIEKAAADRAAGVEDVTAGIKAKNQELIDKLGKWSAFGTTDEVSARLKELEELKKAAEEQKLKGEAEKVGASHEQVEALAEARADAKFRAKVAEWEDRTKKLEAGLKERTDAQTALEAKLREALLDHELYKVAGQDVDPVLYPYLRSEAAKYFKPRTNGDETPWWAGERVEFDLVDPKAGTRLMNDKAEPMTAKELVDGRKAGEWAAFFVPKGRGGGATTTGAQGGAGKLEWNAGSSAYLEQVLK